MSEDGPLVTQAYVCPAKGEKLVLQDITLPALTATQVEVDITHCGLCHTDLHMRDNDWGISNYPLVAGHEGLGKIRKVGSAVTTHHVGDVVGITWIRDSCKDCDCCMAGRENICVKGYQGTFLSSSAGCWGKEPFNEHGGCFSKVMRVEARFAIKIPEGVTPEVACPLLCGGGTVFEPVVDYVHQGTHVAVASIGGLGTAAIKFGKSFGGHVTALSRTEDKREKALTIGADEYYACLKDPDMMSKELAGKFDLIIDTSPVNADVAPFMSMLKFDGTYCRVGIPKADDMDFKYPYIPLIFTQKKIAGSIVTGTRRMKRMLDLVKDDPKYGEDPDNWKAKAVKFDQINETMDDLINGKNKDNWRYILEW